MTNKQSHFLVLGHRPDNRQIKIDEASVPPFRTQNREKVSNRYLVSHTYGTVTVVVLHNVKIYHAR